MDVVKQNIFYLQFHSLSEAFLLQDGEQETRRGYTRTMFKVVTTLLTGTEDEVGSLTVQ